MIFTDPFIYSVVGSPLQFYVDAINSGHVTAFGPGLSHGMVNKPATFTIVTKDAGEGMCESLKLVMGINCTTLALSL